MSTTTRVGDWQIEKKVSLGTVGALAVQAIALVWYLSGLNSNVGANTTEIAKHDARLSSVESDLRKYDNLAYRITVVETANAAVAQKLDTLQQAVNNQGGDLRVVKEILQRLESQSKAAVFDLDRVPSIVRAATD